MPIAGILLLIVAVALGKQNLIFKYVGGIVRPGIDGDLSVLHGQKVGLITNPTGVNSELVSNIDILFNNPRIQLTAFFGMVRQK